MTLEADQRAHRHLELAQLVGAAEIGEIDDEAGGEHLRTELAQELDRAFRSPPVAIRSSTRMTRSPFSTASSCISISSSRSIPRLATESPVICATCTTAARPTRRTLCAAALAEDEACAEARVAGDLARGSCPPWLHQLVDGAAERSGSRRQRVFVAMIRW